MKKTSKNEIHSIIRDCGGEGHYSGKEKHMYIKHMPIQNMEDFEIIRSYLFPEVEVLYY